jgi:hypothetical protein
MWSTEKKPMRGAAIMMSVESAKKNPNRILAALIIASAGARVIMFLVTGYFLDDPFITYRYAENIVRGIGFVYNPGEHVLGTTTPLYALLLASLGLMFGPEQIPIASVAVSIVADMASVFLLWRLLAGFTGPVRLVVCMLFALYPKTVLIGVSGMEASLVVVLMLLSYELIAGRHFLPAYGIFGVLLLTRVDGILWMGVVIAWFAFNLRRGGTRAVPVTLAVLAPWLIFSWVSFGSIIPHSIIAKRVSWDYLYPAFDPVRVLIRYFPFEGMSGWYPAGQSVVVILFLVPVVVGAVLLFRKKDPLGVFPVFFIFYSAFFSMARVSTDMWYYLPGYVAYFVSIGSVLDWLFTRGAGVHEVKRGLLLAYGTGLVLIMLLGVGMARWSHNPGDWFHRHFMDLGAWIRDHSTHGDTVFLEGIGYVGWESRLYILDAVGLVSPDVLGYRLRHPHSDSWYLEYIRDQKPDFVVLRNWEVQQNSLFLGWGDGLFIHSSDREWFHKRYEDARWSERIQEDSVHFVVFRRR